MDTKIDDTLNIGTQSTDQPKENKEQSKKTAKKVNLRDAAVFTAGGIVGATASVVADAFADTIQSPEEEPVDDLQDQVEEPVDEQEEQVQEEAPVTTHQQRTSSHTEPKHEQESESESTQEQESKIEPKQEPEIFREHDVKIETIETEFNDEGELHHVASGTVNGHAALFVDDGHGNVMGYAVDENDNNEIESEEIVHADDQHITLGHLAEHMVEAEVEPVQTPTSENDSVEVIAVENDVDMDGHSVNLAFISVGGSSGALIDDNQNGKVDLLAIDTNQDGEIALDEVEVVTDSHIPMPTADDVSTEYTSLDEGGESELPDYSNDNDITLYDV